MKRCWRYDLEVEQLLSMCKSLGSIPGTTKEEKIKCEEGTAYLGSSRDNLIFTIMSNLLSIPCSKSGILEFIMSSVNLGEKTFCHCPTMVPHARWRNETIFNLQTHGR
jgi:hypothetical protein